MSDFDLDSYWHSEQADHEAVTKNTFASLKDPFARIVDLCVASIQADGKIMFCGNGGSAADAQHLATELSVRFIKDRKPIAGLALTTDTSTLTAAANDYNFDAIFARQIDAIGKEGDVLIALSTSGNSGNVLTALKQARTQNIKTIGFSGRDGGKMKDLCDEILIVPSQSTARIQEMHITLGHMLCGSMEQRLKLV